MNSVYHHHTNYSYNPNNNLNNNFCNVISNDHGDECSICIDELNDGVIRLKCNHKYHLNCILKYIGVQYNKLYKNNPYYIRCLCNKIKCPLCRKTISCKDIIMTMNIYYAEREKFKNKHIKPIRYLLHIKTQFKKCINHIFNKQNQQEFINKQISKESRELINIYNKLYVFYSNRLYCRCCI